MGGAFFSLWLLWSLDGSAWAERPLLPEGGRWISTSEAATCHLLIAKVDPGSTPNLSSDVQTFFRRAEVGQFDFMGALESLPFRPGCGEIWISGCPGTQHDQKWMLVRAGECRDVGQDAKVGGRPAAEGAGALPAGSAQGGAEPVPAPPPKVALGSPIPPTPDEPARASCGQIEPDPENLPEVTGKMQRAATKLFEQCEELGMCGGGGRFHRHNHFSDFSFLAHEGAPEQFGGIELTAIIEETRSIKPKDNEAGWNIFGKIAGHLPAPTDVGAVAMVTPVGFARGPSGHAGVFVVPEYEHHHLAAAGLDLAVERAQRKEAEEQLKLADRLEKVLAWLKKGELVEVKVPCGPVQKEGEEPCTHVIRVVDAPSVRATQEYLELARKRAGDLEITACELASMAAINKHRAIRMRSFSPLPGTSYGRGPGEPGPSEPSSIRLGEDPGMHLGNRGIAGMEGPRSWKEEALEPFGPAPELKKAGAQDDLEADLFTRVKRKHRQLEEAGVFKTSLVDDLPREKKPVLP